MRCNYCHVNNPQWKTHRSLLRHQAACSRKYLQLQAATQLELVDGVQDEATTDDVEMLEPAAFNDPIEVPAIESTSGRPIRVKKKTWKLQEAALDLPPRIRQRLLPEPEPAMEEPSASTVVCTPTNAMGLYRIYPRTPSHNPDDATSLDDLTEVNDNTDVTDRPCGRSAEDSNRPAIEGQTPWSPFLSASVARLLCWFHSGSTQKSTKELDSLVKNVLLKDDFNTTDLKGFSTTVEHTRVDNSLKLSTDSDAMASLFPATSGWEKESVTISLPAPKAKQPEAKAPTFQIKDILVRPLLSVMRDAFQGPEFSTLHLTPFEECWIPPATETQVPDIEVLAREPFTEVPSGHQRTYGEIYTSQKMMDAHRSLPTDPNLETVVVAFMFWSDATHLATFGTASLWPLYTFFGNCSKYLRLKPTGNHCHHQAYIPSLPDSLKDEYRKLHGHPPRPAYLTYLKRELMHAVWRLLLTAEFIHAYVHGIVIKCFDGIARLLFPRFFTYGADYPEKVLLSTIKYLGMKHDMNARVRLNQLRVDSAAIHTKIETARKYIFTLGSLPNGSKVDGPLKKHSLVPTRNAFSILQPYGFNFYGMFVPDLLHEFELGVWKAVFIHLVRILHALGPDSVASLNERYRTTPTFGRDTIRRFHADAAAMKKLAARDYEDLLQCSIPAFEGLLPASHNKVVLDLLFALSTWHALAKLRLHTDSTLQLLQEATTDIGTLLRKFSDTVCPSYNTKDLPREAEARARRTRKANVSTDIGDESSKVVVKLRVFNMNTYKMHALGDYVETIRNLGTSESYSTQVGELEHRRVKRLYSRTNKNNYEEQIAKQEQRQRTLREVRRRLNDMDTELAGAVPAKKPKKKSPMASSTAHHYISQSGRTAITISEYLFSNQNDDAFKDFLPKLKSHLLARILSVAYEGDEHNFSTKQLLDVVIENDRLYLLKVLHINYTSYDGRRCHDSLNPKTNSDFITFSHEDDDESMANQHPLWYGRIVQILHVVVHHPRLPQPQHFDVLWVRWFGRDTTFKAGFSRRRLHRIGFIAIDDAMSFGFLDPNEVIRAIHIIPAFHYGTTQALETSAVADAAERKNEGKWRFYYVGMFSDRDTAMRFIGGAVGHQTSLAVRQEANVELLPEDNSDSDSGIEESMDLAEDPGAEPDDDVELVEDEPENDDDNLDQWLTDHSDEDSDEDNEENLDEEGSDAGSEKSDSESIQLEYW
ncbi:hypothetical protein AB1N83_010639 [Pleurotus pulmonarius]